MHSKLGSCSGMKPVPCLAYLASRAGVETTQLSWPSLSWEKLSSYTGPGQACRARSLGWREKLGHIGPISDGVLGSQEVAGRTKSVA